MADPPAPPVEQNPRRGILAWFADNPFFGFIGFLVGVVSLLATVYFGFASLKKRELSFFVNPVRTMIVRGGHSSDLHVLYKGKPVSTDVTAFQCALWNAGDESIKEPDHVLIPVVLKTSPKVPILEAKLHF